MPQKIEVRCTCSRQPLLAVTGRDNKGNPFVEIRQMKSRRVTTHVLVTSGKAHVQCRECYRWTGISIVEKKTRTDRENLPPDLEMSLST